MNITSIDNCYEIDGLTNLLATLNSLNDPVTNPVQQHRLVAVLPEYRTLPDGTTRLDRLNVCVIADGELLTDTTAALIAAATPIVTLLQQRRAEARARLDADRASS